MAAEPSYKIFIRGIAPTVDENGLELAFSKYGRIMEGMANLVEKISPCGLFVSLI